MSISNSDDTPMKKKSLLLRTPLEQKYFDSSRSIAAILSLSYSSWRVASSTSFQKLEIDLSIFSMLRFNCIIFWYLFALLFCTACCKRVVSPPWFLLCRHDLSILFGERWRGRWNWIYTPCFLYVRVSIME